MLSLIATGRLVGYLPRPYAVLWQPVVLAEHLINQSRSAPGGRNPDSGMRQPTAKLRGFVPGTAARATARTEQGQLLSPFSP